MGYTLSASVGVAWSSGSSTMAEDLLIRRRAPPCCARRGNGTRTPITSRGAQIRTHYRLTSVCSDRVVTPDIAHDTRLDPRLRRMLELMPEATLGYVHDRDELLAEANSPTAVGGTGGLPLHPRDVRHGGGGALGGPDGQYDASSFRNRMAIRSTCR